MPGLFSSFCFPCFSSTYENANITPGTILYAHVLRSTGFNICIYRNRGFQYKHTVNSESCDTLFHSPRMAEDKLITCC